MSKWIDRLFVIAVICVLFLCLGKALFLPDEVNVYENRTANKLQAPAMQSCLDGSFQDSVEDALTDQIPLAERLKMTYNQAFFSMQEQVMGPIRQAYPDQYIRLKTQWLYGGDYIVYKPVSLSEYRDKIQERVGLINASIEAHPEVTFYAFYIEREADINFETGEKSGAYQYLKSQLALPEENISVAELNSFAEYSDHFYKSDIHWGHRGSYDGYQKIAEMLGIPEEERLTPVEEVNTGLIMIGSRSLTIGTEDFYDIFSAYRFDFPEMTVTLDDKERESYGNYEAYFVPGKKKSASYEDFYGYQNAEVILDTGHPERENVLVLGHSFDNPILNLLAANYNKVFAVDMRHYERVFGEAFRFSEYLEENQIDTVLIVGDLYYYSDTTYQWED